LCVALSTHDDPTAFLEPVAWGDPLARYRPQEYVASAAFAPPAQVFPVRSAGDCTSDPLDTRSVTKHTTEGPWDDREVPLGPPHLDGGSE
jgi:hypothetical protein